MMLGFGFGLLFEHDLFRKPVSTFRDHALAAGPNAGVFKLFHRRVGEFSFWAIAADHKHQDGVLAGWTRRDVFEAADRAGRKRNHIERIKLDRFDLTFLVLPTTAPRPRHGNKGLVGVVVMHHRTFAWLGTAVTEIEAFGDRDRRQTRGVVADRRGHRAAGIFGWLETDDVIKRALALRRRAVGGPAVGAFEVIKAGDAL